MGHVATVSNPPCGPDGNAVIAALAPQGYNSASFKSACGGHDICYETCNSVKGQCDASFNAAMESSCRKAWPYPASGEDDEHYRRGVCLARAHLYARLVAGSSVGQKAYDAAQKKACECCECGTLGLLLVDEPAGTLKLTGCFGETQGKVTVGVTNLTVKSWASDAIVCTLPSTGPGSNGDVVVEIPSTTGALKKTKARQLTEWNVPLHYKMIDAYAHTGWTFEGTGSVRYRADVASYLPTDGGIAVFPTRGLSPTLESALPVTASGSFPINSTCSQVLTGSGVFPTAPTTPPTMVLAAMMKIDTSTHTGSLGLGAAATLASIPFKANYVGTNCPPGGEQVMPVTFGQLEGTSMFPFPNGEPMSLGPLPAIELAFDSQFKLLKKTYSGTMTGLGNITLEWTSDVVPISPPEVK